MALSRERPRSKLTDCRSDAVVGAASAQIAGHAFLNLFITEQDGRRDQILSCCAWGGRRHLCQHSNRRAELAWRTITTLNGLMPDKRSLRSSSQSMPSQSFNCSDLPAVALDGKNEAGVDSLSIQEDGAGAACSLVTTQLGASQMEVLA